jgi:hypothetical protein
MKPDGSFPCAHTALALRLAFLKLPCRRAPFRVTLRAGLLGKAHTLAVAHRIALGESGKANAAPGIARVARRAQQRQCAVDHVAIRQNNAFFGWIALTAFAQQGACILTIVQEARARSSGKTSGSVSCRCRIKVTA